MLKYFIERAYVNCILLLLSDILHSGIYPTQLQEEP